MQVNRPDEDGRPSTRTEEVKVGVIKFDNGSRILAFSANPRAMAVYGGDVGLDEFAKHPNAQLLWETAQGRVTWAHDIAVWSAHDGEDTLFYQFAQQAPARERHIDHFIHPTFPSLFNHSSSSSFSSSSSAVSPTHSLTHSLVAPKSDEGGPTHPPLRLGFDLAASGHGDLAAIYIDEPVN